MFTEPLLQEGGAFPELPLHTEPFDRLIDSLGVEFGTGQDRLGQLANFALHHWMMNDASSNPQLSLPYQEVPAHTLLAEAGMVNAILPSRDEYDYVLVDGGSRPIVAHRLAFVEELLNSIKLPDITLLGGQRLRIPRDDLGQSVEEVAESLLSIVNQWSRDWLESELNKSHAAESEWERPFATEHEIAMLALHSIYGEALVHSKEYEVNYPRTLVDGIPPVAIAAQEFKLEDTVFRILNAPAIIREFSRVKLPPRQARPTAQSCFYQWHDMLNPDSSASVLLTTHNPDIYRSWVDFIHGAEVLDRTDLRIEGVGAKIFDNASFGSILLSLGKLITTFDNRDRGYNTARRLLSAMRAGS